MSVTINIDTGGTFTDGYLTVGERAASVKVETTPHDLTECLAACVAEGARSLGYPSTQALLLDTDVFRFSSTLATNSIIQRRGPRVGLLVSAGAGTELYGDGDSGLYDFLLQPDMVIETGDPFDEKEVRAHVRQLLVAGARVIVVSLGDSDVDPSGEQAVKSVIEKDYPRHYLGAVPCLIASEVTARPGAERRTATAVLNAYLHPDMTKALYKADEDQHREGYPLPLLIVQGSGGVARVAKTRAIETYNSGPVGGVYGSVRMAKKYGVAHAVTMDIGGTSTDVSVIADGIGRFADDPEIAGIHVHVPLLAIEAIGGGGGSLARKSDGGYTVGPDSAGAVPGPACYGLGGTNPTVTDAEVVLGHIDPDWFLGGRRKLDPGRARAAVERIASGDATEQSAWNIHHALVALVAATVRSLVARSGVQPSESVLFAFGGAGGLFAADVARASGIPRTYSLVNSPVFSAFGIAGMDISHVYEVRPGDGLAERLDALRGRARMDAAGEGLEPDELAYQLELETPDGLRIVSVNGAFAEAAAAVPQAVSAVRLRSTSAIPHAPLVAAKRGKADSTGARKGERTVWRPDGPVTSIVYDRELLEAGNVVDGLALVESPDTTILVPEWARLTVDEYGSASIEERG